MKPAELGVIIAAMNATAGRSLPRGQWGAVFASLIPWAAFLVASAIADVWVDFKSVSLGGLAASAPFYLGFVALPAFLPLAAAHHRVTRIVVLALMTATATVAGVLVVTTDDAQAGLAVLLVPYVAIPVATVVWIGQAIVTGKGRREAHSHPSVFVPATPSDRLAALAVDVAIVGAALVVPLTVMSHAEQEIAAAIVGVTAGTAYLAAFVAGHGQTIGQSLLGLSVVDARTMTRVAPARACVRSLIVVLEVLGTPTIILSPPALAELVSVVATGRSLTDRLLRTTVLARR